MHSARVYPIARYFFSSFLSMTFTLPLSCTIISFLTSFICLVSATNKTGIWTPSIETVSSFTVLFFISSSRLSKLFLVIRTITPSKSKSVELFSVSTISSDSSRFSRKRDRAAIFKSSDTIDCNSSRVMISISAIISAR